MAYQENTGNSPDDAIDKIATFAAANGWTIHTNTLAVSNRTLVLRKSGDYLQIWNEDNATINITGFIGYDPLLTYSQQSGYAGVYAQASAGVGPYSQLYLLADTSPSEHVHVVIEAASGIVSHLSFGALDPLGIWTGGTYFDATWWDPTYFDAYKWRADSSPLFDCYGNPVFVGAVRCDIPADGHSNTWAPLDRDAAFRVRTGLYGATADSSDGHGYLTTQCYHRNDPPFSGQVTLGTVRCDVIRPGGFWSPIGTYPNVRYLNMARYVPGQEITVGAEVWKVFPMRRKGVGQSIDDPAYFPFSDEHAYAFKKVV